MGKLVSLLFQLAVIIMLVKVLSICATIMKGGSL